MVNYDKEEEDCSLSSLSLRRQRIATSSEQHLPKFIHAFEQHFDKKWKSTSAVPIDSENQNGCFDCNICLDFAVEPVVTLCGHLYCWPCIYKWFHIHSASLPSDEYPQCPVCKAEISHTTVIPLYGRGRSSADLGGSKVSSRESVVPSRPPACETQALLNASSQLSHELPYRNSYQGQQHYPNLYTDSVRVPFSALDAQGRNTVANALQPDVGMFGEMVYARIFGNSHNLYTYPNSYHVAGSSRSRLRRHEMHVNKSLSRISLFLVCGVFLCLILF